VGMSQWGAKGMAEQGYTAAKILEYYYPGTTLGSLGAR
jgi:stage II sporulation protein D